MILSPVLFKERLTRQKIIGFLIVLVGIILVNGKMAAGHGKAAGLFCGAMSAVMYFFMVTLNKKSEKITGMENVIVQLTVSFLTVAFFLWESSRAFLFMCRLKHGHGFLSLA